ncbi:MAG: efflux RND transporter periplasmic adaptor subunit [Candidatus Eisenbacteria bacterium]|uniref:Efflux RND transporter periplasmic adaptor subunit n=1 Tax=Eiseniibacteriota bacterium TaxID=2212470 RepID=A0A956SDN2_UNCEI|nr:efflux RND transporter periplasmic adaptor subunit [Candidatus Eisenbacteria bacterium]MCB9463385.1 efflux RND transporter periplasmic adaptor subunit [Candidatus Eisenbacteria bacterium]
MAPTSRRTGALPLLALLLGVVFLVAQVGCGRGNASNGDSDPGSSKDKAAETKDATNANGDDEAQDASTSADSAGVASGASGTESGDGDTASSSESDSTQTESKSWKDKLFHRGDDEAKKEDPPVPVETARVDRRDIPAFLSSTATLEPEKQATVLAKISGQVTQIVVEEGDWVEKGAVLAELDGAQQRVGLEEAAAKARGLGLELDRIRALHDQDLASDKQLNDAQAAFDQAEAARKSNELLVQYTKVRAPFSGQVSTRRVDPGQNVDVGRELFDIVDRTPLLARIYLPEHNVKGLAAGQEIWVETDADQDGDTVDLPGEVLRVAPVVDTRTGTVKVTCQFADDGARVRPGSFVRVKVQTGVHEDVLSIPKRALVPEGAETYVFRTEADSVIKVPIETGFTDADFVEVVEGLSQGDRIVTVGHGGLKPGSKIDDLTSDRAEVIQ